MQSYNGRQGHKEENGDLKRTYKIQLVWKSCISGRQWFGRWSLYYLCSYATEDAMLCFCVFKID